MEKQIKMAARLYEGRDTAKRFFRDEYQEKIKPYSHILSAVMKANNLDEIPALLKISETKTYQENAMGQMMFMAAVVEMIEPLECHHDRYCDQQTKDLKCKSKSGCNFKE